LLQNPQEAVSNDCTGQLLVWPNALWPPTKILGTRASAVAHPMHRFSFCRVNCSVGLLCVSYIKHNSNARQY